MQESLKDIGGHITGKWNNNSYRIVRKLGTGGTAEVFLVEGEGKKRYAMKVSQDSLSLNREYQLIKKFSDIEFVVNVYEMDDFHRGGCIYHFLLLDYIQGDNLKVYTEKKQLQRTTILGMILILLKVLESFHQKGYILGDLKLENIMFDQKQKAIRLIDLGGVVEIGATVKEYTPAYDRGAWRCGKRRAEVSYDLFTLNMMLILLLIGEKLNPLKQKKEDIFQKVRNLEISEELKGLVIDMMLNQCYNSSQFAKKINELYNKEKLNLVKMSKVRGDALISNIFRISLGFFIATGCLILITHW
ncbi:protein kinase domain-containing protein [Alkaliphilus hydrothermalis]|uniref:Serine/threonine-protein kinase n=1 Tax=Alkaliphilus hydrothermalis TaxID=1482730 RepID=A0ABS2NSN9_9FIRM|nr:hypothetical protein [Alkaliphilus hydrothermalis]MBM7615968.1 serine/threonine-protein kinase [Alkaliphilus hydrothermalis]